LRELWEQVQSMPEYKGKTTLIVLPDHGRGEGAEWTSHGQKIPASRQTWMAFLGPDTAAKGERGTGTEVTEAQVAATVASLLDQNYRNFAPQAAAPVTEAIEK
jgi:hypothetical protein